MSRPQAGPSTGPTPAPSSERWIAAALLAFLVVERLVLMVGSQVELYHPEEYLNLDIFRSFSAGVPLRELVGQAYGSGRGLDGGGSLFQGVLLLGLASFFGPSQIAVKGAALLWFVAGAMLSSALGRRLFGAWGGVATLLAIAALPSAFLIYSACTWGRHLEGAVLVQALFLVALRAGEPQSPPGWCFALGLLLAAAAWFSPLASLPAGLVLLTLPWILRGRRPEAAAWVGAGLSLGAFAAVSLGQGSTGLSTTFAEVLSKAGNLPTVLGRTLGALASVPTFSVDWPGRWRLPSALTRVADPAYCALAWAAMAFWLARSVRSGERSGVLSVVIVLSTFGLPLILAALDVAQDNRLVAVSYGWALGLGSVLQKFLGAHATGWGRRVAVVLLVSALGFPGFGTALSGTRPGMRFEPGRFAAPLGAAGPVVSVVARDHVGLLDRIVHDPRLARPADLASALYGFEAIVGGTRDPLHLRPAHCPDDPINYTRQLQGAELWNGLSWETWGATLSTVCGDRAEARCATLVDQAAARSCLDGVRWAREVP